MFGVQEYSSRQAGITAGIIMAIMIPLLLCIIYAAYKFFKSRSEASEAENVPRPPITITRAAMGTGEEGVQLTYPRKETEVD